MRLSSRNSAAKIEILACNVHALVKAAHYAAFAPQGFLDKLLDRHDGLSKEVLRHAVFYMVRNLCAAAFRQDEQLSYEAVCCLLLMPH